MCIAKFSSSDFVRNIFIQHIFQTVYVEQMQLLYTVNFTSPTLQETDRNVPIVKMGLFESRDPKFNELLPCFPVK